MGILELIATWSKTWKGIATCLVILAVLVYAIFYNVNSYLGEKENELIPIEDSNVPHPSDFDSLCGMSNEGKPCPKLGKSKL